MIELSNYHNPFTDDAGDWTLALDKAVVDATLLGQCIKFPVGWLKFRSRPKPMGCGIVLEGDAGITSAKLGTCVVADYEEPDSEAGLFTWDGSDPRGYKGTGGGIRNMSLYRLAGPSGGTAIRLVCTNATTFRAGWWSLQNVAVLAENKSTWDHCLTADGTKVGVEGLRWLHLSNFMASGGKLGNIILKDVVHFYMGGGQVQGGHTVDPHTDPPGILVTGRYSQDIHFSGVSVYDTVRFQQCEQFSFMGGIAKWLILEGGHKVRRGIIQTVCDALVNGTAPTSDKVIVQVV